MQLATDTVLAIQLAVAQNPGTPTAVLELLAKHPEQAIQEAVLGHPNATEEILHQLFKPQQHRIKQQENLPVSILERFFREATETPIWQDRNLRNLLLKQANTPAWVLARLADVDLAAFRAEKLATGNPELWIKSQIIFIADIAKHPQVSVEILERLSQYPDSDIQLAVAQNPLTPLDLKLRLLEDLSIDRDREIQVKVARDVNTPVQILEAMARNESRQKKLLRSVAVALVGNPSTPVKWQSQLQNLLTQSVDIRGSYRSSARQAVSRNPNAPTDTVLKTPKSPPLERYRLLLIRQQKQEVAKAQELMARRTDSPYAMLQVLEKGDRNAKLTAARSNKTPIQVLEQLAKDTDETVRQVVLQNQNLPLHSLLELAKDESVNVRLWLAYNSSPRKTQKPVQLLEQLAQDTSEQVRARVAGLSETPAEILVRLADDSSREVKVALTSNPNTPVAILTRLGLEENLVNQRNPNTPSEVLAHAVNRILGSFHQNDLRWSGLESTNKPLVELLKHPPKGSQMPASTLERLAAHHYPPVRYRVAAHPNTPTSALEQLACDSYVPTLRALADNPNTPPHILAQLANTPDLTTRLSIVRNPNTPAQVLAQIVLSTQNSGNQPNRSIDALKSAIAGSHNDLLRTIASNPRTPIEALEILARREFVSVTQDPQSIIPPTTNDSVVRSLTYNPSLTPQLLHILAQDPCVDVRASLTRHPNLTEALWTMLARDEALAVREAVAVNREAPERVLELLARDEQGEVRVKVVTNPNTEIAILVSLAGDENSAVRAAVASHPSLPTAQLESLAQDQKVEVRRAVAQNPHTPNSIRETLLELVSPPQTKQTSPTLRGLPRLYNPKTDDLATLLAEYARSPNAFVRLVTLLHPLTSSEILQQGAKSVSWLERYAVAENPATPTELRQQLAQDSNRFVRAVANTNLST